MDEQGSGSFRSRLAAIAGTAVSFLIGAVALGWIVRQTPLWDPAAAAVYGLALRSGLVLPQAQAPSPAAAARAQASADAAGGGAATPAAQDHLLVSHTDMDLAAHERTSARIDAAGPAAEDGKSPAKPGRKPFKTPHLRAGTSFASGTIRYGTSSRSELMGRGAGPVYNFKSNSGAAGSSQLPGDIGSGLRQASEQLDQTKKAVDSNPHLTSDGKTVIDGHLDDAQSRLKSVTPP